MYCHDTVSGLLDNLHGASCAATQVAAHIGSSVVPAFSVGSFAGDLRLHYYFGPDAIRHLDTLTERLDIDWDPSGDLDEGETGTLGMALLYGVKVFFELSTTARRVAA
jgi:hypothetical protein